MRRAGPALLLLLAACGARPAGEAPLRAAFQLGAPLRAQPENAVLERLLASKDGAYDDPALVAYVAEVGVRVAAHAGKPGQRWTFHVLDEAGLGARSVSLGHVWIDRGLLAILDSEAELAAALAHEVAHVAAGHGSEALSDLGAGPPAGSDPDEDALARDMEHQADRLAAGYLSAAGYDPRALLSMLRAVHAAQARRPAATPLEPRLARAALAIGGSVGGELGRPRFLQRLDGLVIGADPRAGRVEGGRYVNERSGVVLTLPPGLTPKIESRSMEAVDAGESAGLAFSSHDSSWVPELIVCDMKKNGSVERRPVLGGVALVGQIDGQVGWTAVVAIGEHDHILAAKGPDRAAQRRLLDATLATYQAVTAGDRRSPQRIRIAVAERSAPVAELLALGCGDGDRALGLWLSGPRATEVLRAGEPFKCASKR